MNVRLSPESDDCCGGTHGEHRLDNLMFGGPEGASPVAGVDWQTPGNGLGITDVSYFLAAGLLPRDRRLIERDLVDEYALAGIVLSVIASQIVGSNDRSEAMFAAMATRDAQHALDPKSEALL